MVVHLRKFPYGTKQTPGIQHDRATIEAVVDLRDQIAACFLTIGNRSDAISCDRESGAELPIARFADKSLAADYNARIPHHANWSPFCVPLASMTPTGSSITECAVTHNDARHGTSPRTTFRTRRFRSINTTSIANFMKKV